ncbi:DEHA2F00242p [Debaryomyces hansenii CBS767]|uniref:DEHA2F00242p n=1 Tax=Debaryomyces hansenii (strain ATCC 36239 / CBS 767 / BCRC 21394 / JCM 1990 / NBRC 0083 / IGC 2968) TaxID=284592 RepID=W0TYS9_DEBHA|nr:DEHA2F00242p [Debaryomyces hansenii CBS767]CAG88666.4 DEHA2F00242p [Debaryomyces hansenii CBS767]|eukprot:XP_002770720.1 DEHA2F00242p [Debaryomyces hansenii CBS767]
MIIDYHIIHDPETVEDGITLRSAIAGFFYKSVGDAADTKARLMEIFSVASSTDVKSIKESDPFFNVHPRDPSGSSGKLDRPGFSGNLDSVKENDSSDNFDAIDGNTYC